MTSTLHHIAHRTKNLPPLRVGIGGPVGSGKTTLLEMLCKDMREKYDLVAIIRVADNEALARVVTEHMLKVSGITKTETLIAFQAFSKHDLERMFSIGA